MREKMLDGSKQNYFKYDLQDLMKGKVGEEHVNSLIQSLWAKGSRTDIDEAKDFLKEKAKEGIVPPDVEAQILRILDRYSTWR